MNVQLHSGNPSMNVYNVNEKQGYNNRKPEKDSIKIRSNGDSKTKIMVVVILWLNIYDGRTCLLKRIM